MTGRVIHRIVWVCLWAALAAGCASMPRDTLTQYSTLDPLLMGLYDGDFALGALHRYGDFGLGTFNALDGEMVVLDGVIYQVASTGDITPMPHAAKTPFATVSFFVPDQTFAFDQGLDFAAFEKALDARLPSDNLFYAIRVKGQFPFMKTRSVPRQAPPYRPLADVVKEQAVFEFHDVAGTIVGYRCPPYVKGGVNVPGYHLHFLSDDRREGGHILDFTLGENQVALDQLSRFTLIAPEQGPFLTVDLSGDRSDDVTRVEKLPNTPKQDSK